VCSKRQFYSDACADYFLPIVHLYLNTVQQNELGDSSQHLTLAGKISRSVDFDKSDILSLCWRATLQKNWFVTVTKILFNFFSKENRIFSGYYNEIVPNFPNT
jgi:hypothetical protein